MNKLLVICGPTATGKTALGIKLAKNFNGEIISADSRQVYKGMDIGTGKDMPESSNLQFPSSNLSFKNFKLGYYSFDSIPVWLLDIVNPDYKFSVADYVECVNLVIEDVFKRGKLPILVGGTGFYIKGVVDGIETLGIAPNWELRGRLREYDTKILRAELEKLNPKRLEEMNESDRNNPRRLIRAIEIAQSSNKKAPLRSSGQASSNIFPSVNSLVIALTAPYKVLYQRIDERVDKRVETGMENEIKTLLSKGYSWEKSALGTTMGYKEWRPFFESRAKIEEIIKKWKFAEHGLARRQLTWFKRDNRVHWFDISQANWQLELENLIQKWYYQSSYAD